MKRKKTIILVSVIFVIFAVGLATVVIKSTLNETAVADTSTDDNGQDVAGNNAEEETGDGAKTADSSSASGLEAAEGLIGQTLTREEIEETLGECEKFDMSGEGCERGVYAGRFYYDGYAIFSRTYDKGQTFSIVSVNE